MPDLHGPLRKGRFVVEIDGVSVQGFKRVELPNQTTQYVEYREGHDPIMHRKLWNQVEYDDLVLERGAKKDDTELYDWRQQVIDGDMEEARRDVAVSLLNSIGEATLRWEFTQAWPCEYRPPDLETASDGGQGNVATETVVVTFEEMQRTE